MLLRPIPAPLAHQMRKSNLSPGARMRRIFDSSPSVELPLDSARHALTGHGLLLMQKLRRPRGCAYPRLGYALLKGKRAATRGGAALFRLVLLFPSFFPAAFARQCFLHALLLARLQVKGVALNLLDYVLLLHLALEPAQCILKGLALLQSDFCQRNYTPKLVQWDCIVIARFCAQVKFYVR
jgi:hypothetical protein